MRRGAIVTLTLCLVGCAPPDVRIRGQVVSADGGAVAGVVVNIDRGDSPQRTDDDGRFEFELSLDDAVYDDPGEHAAPLSVWVGDLLGESASAEFSVDQRGTVELPPLVEWEGAFVALDGGIATPRPKLAELAPGYAISEQFEIATNDYILYLWSADYGFDASTATPIVPLDPDVLEDQSVTVILSAYARVGGTLLTANAKPFTLKGTRAPLSRGAPCDDGTDAGVCPYTDGQFRWLLASVSVPFVTVQLPAPALVTEAIVRDFSSYADCLPTVEAAGSDAGFTDLAIFPNPAGVSDVALPLRPAAPVSVVRLRCTQPDGGAASFQLDQFSIF